MITHDIGMAHPIWMFVLVICVAAFWVVAIHVAVRLGSGLFGRMVWTTGCAAALYGFVVAGLWASRTAYVYDRCDVMPQCQNIVVGEVYTR